MKWLIHHPLVKLLFFGNLFYGLCVVALSVESSLQQKYPLNSVWFYLLQLMSTVYYYNLAFSQIDGASTADNLRAAWHYKHKRILTHINIILLMGGLLLLFALIWPYRTNLASLGIRTIFLLSLFPLFALLYYGVNKRHEENFSLRKIGWLKPFIIGFTWAGMVGVLPQLLFALRHQITYHFGLINALLFLKNFMYVSVLAIMFDIKDYARDYNYEVRTFVVHFGLRRTLFSIIIPLLLLGLASFVAFALLRHFHPLKIALNCLPFLLCTLVAFSLQKRKSILFYLLVIDGLMLVKAICGSFAMLYF
ncbi:MAG TPA: hypothetical protein PLQ93_11660 [Bacteroidia bacterium]|nr:hypothetical protein [Bacteroidia bacterium]